MRDKVFNHNSVDGHEREAERASKSPLGFISNPSPWLKMMQNTPAKAMSEPIASPSLIRALKKAAIRIVVKIGETDASNDTLPAVVLLRA